MYQDQSLDRRLMLKLLEAHRETIPAVEVFQLERVDTQIALLKNPTYAYTLNQQGGAHLGAVRNWIQCKVVNGERVTWGSEDEVKYRGRFSVRVLEELSATIAAAAINEFKGVR